MANKGGEKRRIRRPSYLRGPVVAGKVRAKIEEGKKDESDKSRRAQQEAQEDQKEELKKDLELYSWKVWLLPRRPLVSVLVVTSLIGSIALAYWAFPRLFFILVISVILVNRLAPYLFPVRYILREETVGYKTFLARDIRPWQRLFTYYEFPDGVLLTYDTRSIRGRIREGLFLYYDETGSNKDEILSIVRKKLKPPEEAFVPKKEQGYKGGFRSALRRIRSIRSKKD